MNEIGVERPSLRRTDRYERFVSRIVGALRAQDDTRPFIENDWIDPDTVLVPTVPVVHAAVGVFKPPPRPAAGLVLGALDVAGGTIIACQYRLQAALESGSATAWAVFADIVSWANDLSHIAENQQAASGTEATDGPVQ